MLKKIQNEYLEVKKERKVNVKINDLFPSFDWKEKENQKKIKSKMTTFYINISYPHKLKRLGKKKNFK